MAYLRREGTWRVQVTLQGRVAGSGTRVCTLPALVQADLSPGSLQPLGNVSHRGPDLRMWAPVSQ